MTGRSAITAQATGSELSYGSGAVLFALVVLVLVGIYLAERLFDRTPLDPHDGENDDKPSGPGAP